MDGKVFEHQVIMTIGKTQNGFILTEDVVRKSLDTFIGKPVIYNKDQGFKHYAKNVLEQDGYYDCDIGYIKGDVHIENNLVYANVFIYENYIGLWHGKYDNWLIDVNDNKKNFVLDSIEVF